MASSRHSCCQTLHKPSDFCSHSPPMCSSGNTRRSLVGSCLFSSTLCCFVTCLYVRNALVHCSNEHTHMSTASSLIIIRLWGVFHLLCSTPPAIYLKQRSNLRSEWAAGVVTGFHVDKHTLKITQLWSSVYASPGVEVLELAARNPAEHVYSQAKVCNTQTLAHICMTASLLISHKV